MRVHHLNCISTCPLGGKLMDDRTESIVRRGHLTCHCLLVEGDSSLVLVDTGLGLRDVENPKSRLSWFFLSLVSPRFREEMTAVRQVQRLGFDPRDVRHIVLTHLDFDHAGGLDDFPGATVHLLAAERDAAVAQKTWLDRQRFRPEQWSMQPEWRVYQAGEGEAWFGFNRVQALDGLPPDIITLVPLIGHTLGHAGVAVNRGDQWLLQAGDAYGAALGARHDSAVLTVPPDVTTATCTSVSIGQATAVDGCGSAVTIVNDAPASYRAEPGSSPGAPSIASATSRSGPSAWSSGSATIRAAAPRGRPCDSALPTKTRSRALRR